MISPYNEIEEKFNVFTHLCGLLLAVIGTFFLLFLKAKTSTETISYLVYGASGVILYLMSTLYHASKKPSLRRTLKICDHAAIYFFIAGCYTPFILIHLDSVGAKKLLLLIWILAFLGATLKLFFTGRFRLVSTLIYLAMGWLAVSLGEEVSYQLSTETIIWIVSGGLAYSLGTFFYLYRRIPFHHGIWHLFVLLGSLLHFIALLSAS